MKWKKVTLSQDSSAKKIKNFKIARSSPRQYSKKEQQIKIL